MHYQLKQSLTPIRLFEFSFLSRGQYVLSLKRKRHECVKGSIMKMHDHLGISKEAERERRLCSSVGQRLGTAAPNAFMTLPSYHRSREAEVHELGFGVYPFLCVNGLLAIHYPLIANQPSATG